MKDKWLVVDRVLECICLLTLVTLGAFYVVKGESCEACAWFVASVWCMNAISARAGRDILLERCQHLLGVMGLTDEALKHALVVANGCNDTMKLLLGSEKKSEKKNGLENEES